MLTQISVANIALIDEVEVSLGEGLNILTGETGAGKSILLGAVNLCLGAKSAKDVVRDPERPASVDLLFTEVSQSVIDALAEMDIEAEDGEVLLSRRFGSNGKGTSRINGVAVTAAQVKSLAQLLIDIHGQHEHQSLLNTASHIEILDRFSPESARLREQMKALWSEHNAIEAELEELSRNESEKDRLLALMQYESDEIAAADLVEGEEEELSDLRKRLLYAGRLKEDSLKAYAALKNSEAEPCALDMLESAASLMENLERYDGVFFASRREALQSALAIADDIAVDLRSYAENIDEDEGRLAEIEDRLDLIHRMKTKYGRSIPDIYKYKEKNDAEILKLQHIAEALTELREKQALNRREMEKTAGALHEERAASAEKISGQITEILKTLQFSDPCFTVSLTPGSLSAKGADSVCFMIRTNVGDEIKPLSQIASGGEVSRIMLAIKTVLAEQDEIGTLIFDEIDTGISGRTAQSVAEKMCRIAGYRQVIAVTHLAQLAAMADTHLRITKEEEGGRTYTRVEALDPEAQTEELARLVGGLRLTDAVYENAREMKKLALAWKKENQCLR